MKIVTLIGSRKAPKDMLILANQIGEFFDPETTIRRSGGAIGMDSAWLLNKRSTDEVYRPDSRIVTYEQEELAATLVPYYENISRYAQLLHARNTAQILGNDLNTPCDEVYFWAPEVCGKVKGGTRTAVNLAKRHGIPTYNLYDYLVECKMREMIGQRNPLKIIFG